MEFDERQRAMLAEMGIRVWESPSVAAGVDTPVEEPAGEAAPNAPTQSRPVARSAAPLTARPAYAARGEVAGMQWAEIRDAVAGCTACKLCDSRSNTVFGVGHERARWMVVGEAPGEQEDAAGEPFVGKAGQLLDAMLRSLGLSRQPGDEAHQVFIANVLKCRPPGNRNPEPDEIAQCLPFLQRQIELVQPKVILAMGRFAVQALLGSSEPIGRLRGQVHRYEGVPVIVTYHPAYLLRTPTDKARAWDDLCMAREVMERSLAEGD